MTVEGKWRQKTVVIVSTPVDRARLYFRYRPAQVLLAADPDAATHRAFGVPAFDFVEDESAAQWPFRFTMQQFRSVLINPTGAAVAPERLRGEHGAERDGWVPAQRGRPADRHRPRNAARRPLPDRSAGIVRWAEVEAAARTANIGRWPADEKILSAARALPG